MAAAPGTDKLSSMKATAGATSTRAQAAEMSPHRSSRSGEKGAQPNHATRPADLRGVRLEGRPPSLDARREPLFLGARRGEASLPWRASR